MHRFVASNITEKEGEDVDSASKINHNYKNLLDSDSEEDDKRDNSTVIPEPKGNEENEDEKMVTRDLSSSSDSGPEKSARMKDRRKNSNPMKKILPVKTVRVSPFFVFV